MSYMIVKGFDDNHKGFAIFGGGSFWIVVISANWVMNWGFFFFKENHEFNI